VVRIEARGGGRAQTPMGLDRAVGAEGWTCSTRSRTTAERAAKDARSGTLDRRGGVREPLLHPGAPTRERQQQLLAWPV